jgi:hypothetical protein
MVQIPDTFQSAGWILPTVIFLWCGLLVGFICLYLTKAVTLMPGNRRMGRRMEFADLARDLFPRWMYLLTMVRCGAAVLASAALLLLCLLLRARAVPQRSCKL